MANNKKEVFKIKDGDKEIEIAVKRPTSKDDVEAQKEYYRAYNTAVESGAKLRVEVQKMMRERKIWDDAKEALYTSLRKRISANEVKLKSGGFKLKEAREVALSVIDDRAELRELLSERNSLDAGTAEALGENAKLNYLVYLTTVYNTSGEKYFTSYDDYLSKSNSEVAMTAAQTLAGMVFGLDKDFEKNLPENQFLLKYKFVDSDLRFIDKDGNFTDRDGRLVDKNGFYINENGEKVDQFGNLVDETGEYVVEFSPFLDEDGKPVE